MDNSSNKKLKKSHSNKKIVLITVILSLFLITAILFFLFCNFTSLGYNASAAMGMHGFYKLSDNIYIDKDFKGNSEFLLSNIDKAKERVSDFFGDYYYDPKIIITDDPQKIQKLSGDHDTKSFTVLGFRAYVHLSPGFASDINIVAHELTHAQTHYLVFHDKIIGRFQVHLPAWFDEGIAMQNDHRAYYNDDAWNNLTDNGKDVFDITSIKDRDFYSSNNNEQNDHYILARYEVQQWINENGRDALVNLLNDLNSGKNFDDIYFNDK